MDVVKVVEQWILLHAVRKKYAHVLHSFSHKVDKPLLEWFPPCVLETFTLYLIIQRRDVKNYETAVSIVLDLYPAISDIIEPSVVAKIVDALKVVMLFDLLKENSIDEKLLVEKINKYFPRSCRGYNESESSDLKQSLMKHCSEYRRLFLKLLALPQYRQSFMMHIYSKQFGKRFEMRLEDHVQRIVAAVENKLPISPIEKILHDDSTPSFSTRLCELKLAVIELLLDFCADKEQLTGADCIQLLDILRPSLPSQQAQDDFWHAKSRSSESDNLVPVLDSSVESNQDSVAEGPGIVTGKQQTDSDMTHVIILSDDDDDDRDTDGGSTSEQNSQASSTIHKSGITREALHQTAKLQHITTDSCGSRTDIDDRMKYELSQEDDTDIELICSKSPASSLASEELSSPIVPSSYSIDKFQTIVYSPEHVTSSTLPSIGKHLRSSSIKNCIVKLKHDKTLDGFGDVKQGIMWFS